MEITQSNSDSKVVFLLHISTATASTGLRSRLPPSLISVCGLADRKWRYHSDAPPIEEMHFKAGFPKQNYILRVGNLVNFHSIKFLVVKTKVKSLVALVGGF